MAEAAQTTGNDTGIVTQADILSLIARKAGVKIDTRTVSLSWFSRRTAVEVAAMLPLANDAGKANLFADLKPTVFKPGEPCPLNPRMDVFDLFDDEEEMRVYCLSKQDPDPKAEAIPPARFRLSKKAAVFSLSYMMLDAFTNEIADEYSNLIGGMSSAEKERSAILEWISVQEADYPLSELATDLKEEAHLDGFDDDEEEPEDPVDTSVSGSGHVTLAPPASVPPEKS